MFADFANWGDDLFDWADEKQPQSAPVALAAPGVDVLSTWDDGGLHEGSGSRWPPRTWLALPPC